MQKLKIMIYFLLFHKLQQKLSSISVILNKNNFAGTMWKTEKMKKKVLSQKL